MSRKLSIQSSLDKKKKTIDMVLTSHYTANVTTELIVRKKHFLSNEPPRKNYIFKLLITVMTFN